MSHPVTRSARVAPFAALVLVLACSEQAPMEPSTLLAKHAHGPIGWSPWSAPVSLGPIVNSAATDQQPAISKDGLSLYFASQRAGGFGDLDLYVSQRTSLDDPWGPPQNLGPTINTAFIEHAPNFSPDGHRMFFHSTRPGCGGADLYVSRRQDRRDDFGWEAPVNLGCVVNTPFDDAGPTYFEDESTGLTTLMFNSNRPGGPGNFDIYESTLQPDGSFGPAVVNLQLSGPARDTRTTISRNGLELFISSDVTGRIGGIGSQDLWVSTRATTSDPWSTPVNLGPIVNSTRFDGAPALSFDGTALYFFSGPGGTGNNDLYVTTRARVHY